MNDTAKYPYWSGTYNLSPSPGYVIMRRRLFVREPVAVFDFSNDRDDPLTLHVGPLMWYRPFRHFDTDFGSVPTILQGLVSPTCSPNGYLLHDGAYEMHACFAPWGLLELTQGEADNLLYVGMRADGCSKYLAGKAWAGVRAGGWTQWPKDPITLANKQRAERARQNRPLDGWHGYCDNTPVNGTPHPER